MPILKIQFLNLKLNFNLILLIILESKYSQKNRLEEQHKTELESYRLELHKWQSETISLRKQFSENRMKLAKENISISKDLQEKENQIQDLSVTCQQLQVWILILFFALKKGIFSGVLFKIE